MVVAGRLCATELVPKGGGKGGELLFEGTPKELAEVEGNYTAEFLREKLGR